MALTRNQFIYLAVLGMALIALLLDRTVFSPDPASGGERSAVISDAEPTPPAPAGAVAPVPDVSRAWRTRSAVADHLARLAADREMDTAEVRDAFLPSDAWFSDDAPVAGKSREEREREFGRRHTLLAVMSGSGGATALIEALDDRGKPYRRNLRVDDVMGEFTVLRIDERSITFVDGDAIVVLSLPDPHGVGGGSP